MPSRFSSTGNAARVADIARSQADKKRFVGGIDHDRDRGPLAGEGGEGLAFAGLFAALERLFVQRVEEVIDEQLGRAQPRSW